MALFSLSHLRVNPTTTYQQMFDRAVAARRPFDRELWMNLAFFMGRQYTEWNDDTASIRTIPKPKDQPNIPRPVSNKIQHFVLQEHAMVLQTRPSPDVLPASDDPMDISNAEVLLAYLDWLANEQVGDFSGVLAQATLWALAGTEAYIKWGWDPAEDDGMGGKGRGVFTAVPASDVYPDPYALRFDDARYAFHARFMDIEEIYDMTGIEVNPTQVDVDPARIGVMREMGMGTVLEGAMVVELWHKPTRRYPKGLFAMWSGNTMLVEPQPLPYDHMQLPFTQIGSVPWLGTPHYFSAVSSMRSAQMELNNFHQQDILVRQAFANPKWGLPNELEMETLPDDSPNQILRYNSLGGTIKPEIIQPAVTLRADQGAWIRQEMMDIVGLHEVSQAQVPGRVEAAKAIELLQESDNGRLAELLRSIKKAISIGFYQEARLVRQYGKPNTVFRTYSREGFPEVKQLWTKKISPAIQIRVTMGGGLGESRAAREDRAMTMWQNGIIQDKEQMAELLDMPIQSMSPGLAFDIRLARNENLKIAHGIAVVPNSWDNHDIHRREHNNYRKTSEYQMLSKDAKQKFEFHVNMHDTLQIQQLGHQLQIQQMAAAVASGQGFSMPAGAPGEGAQQPPGAAPRGGNEQGGAPGIPGTPGLAPGTSAAGANVPPDPFAQKDSPQGQAYYAQRTEANLHKPRE